MSQVARKKMNLILDKDNDILLFGFILKNKKKFESITLKFRLLLIIDLKKLNRM